MSKKTGIASGSIDNIDDDCVIVCATPTLKQSNSTRVSHSSMTASRATEKPKCASNSRHDTRRDSATKPRDLSHLNVTKFPSPNGRNERSKCTNQSKGVKRNRDGPMVYGCTQNDGEDASVIRETQDVSTMLATEDRQQNQSAQQIFSPECKTPMLMTPNIGIDRSISSPDMIPDTPDSDPFKTSSTTKSYASRSFLSSSAILGTGGRIHKKAVVKKSVTRKKRSSSSVVLANELGGENPVNKWNSRDENFMSALVETGIDVVLPPSEKSVVNYASGVKRGSVKGLSPDPKRIAGRRRVRSREHGNALASLRTKLDMQDERLSPIADNEPPTANGNISSARDRDNTEAPRNGGDEDERGGEVGSEEGLDSCLGVDIVLRDGQKVREAAEEETVVEDDDDVNQERRAFRWSNKRRSNVTIIKSEGNGPMSDVCLGDATLGDILSEIQGQSGHPQGQSRNTKAVMTGAGLKADSGRDSNKQNCGDISLKEAEHSNGNEVPVSTAHNAGDADLLDILSELKTQFAIAQSPCEKKCQPSPNVTKLRHDGCQTQKNIPSGRIPSYIVTNGTLDGDTALNDIMEELAPRQRNLSQEQQRNMFAVRSLKMSKRSKLGVSTDTTSQNSSNQENVECCSREGLVEVDSRHLAVDTREVNMETKETSSLEPNIPQSSSVNHSMLDNDTSAQPRGDTRSSNDDLDSTLMRNFLLDDSLESGLNCDFGKLSPFKSVTARR